MVRNLYLLLVVTSRALGLFLIARAVIGSLLVALLQQNLGASLVTLIPAVPALVGGIVLWLGAKWIAALVTRDLE
ncbi:hypothetical protein [Opitutus terrae]|uniref:Uncharacterized protein n=1 Tax=Opitutus terrae (strain DSM 11246 / JCM 15787 / PB90-1) TaxID=452637 RepID=B1ZWD5_OPITP|nr:hypothetical protein [Opitutus terrae]ACB76887.1 hypothetical protein Oter_3610 [Opitutus terrae PB90-1]